MATPRGSSTHRGRSGPGSTAPESPATEFVCGTVAECKQPGIPGVGMEANPMADFASRVKTKWTPQPDLLYRHALAIDKETSSILATEAPADDFPTLGSTEPPGNPGAATARP